MSEPAILNLSVLYDDQRAELIKELEGATVVVTENLVRAYRDGKELDAHLDMIGNILRMDNPEGIYRVSAETPAPKPEGNNPIAEIWAKRTGRVSDEEAVARLKDVYANRQAQFTA